MLHTERQESDSDLNTNFSEQRSSRTLALAFTFLSMTAATPLARAFAAQGFTGQGIESPEPVQQAIESTQSVQADNQIPAEIVLPTPESVPVNGTKPVSPEPIGAEPTAVQTQSSSETEGWSRYWKGFSTALALGLAYAAGYRLVRKVSSESTLEARDKLDFESGRELHSAKINLHIITEENGLAALRIQTLDKISTANIFSTMSSRYFYERVARECRPDAQLITEHYEDAARNWWSRRFFGLFLPLSGKHLASPETVRDRHNDDLGAILSKLNVQGAQRKEAGEDVIPKPFVMIDTCEAKPNGTMDLILRVISYEDFTRLGDHSWFDKLVEDNPDYSIELGVLRTAFIKEQEFQRLHGIAPEREHLPIGHPRRSEPPDRTLFPWARWFLSASKNREVAPLKVLRETAVLRETEASTLA